MLMEVAPHLPVTYASSSLVSLLIDGVNWLKKAAKIHASCCRRKFKLSYAEEVLEQSKVYLVFSLFLSNLRYILCFLSFFLTLFILVIVQVALLHLLI